MLIFYGERRLCRVSPHRQAAAPERFPLSRKEHSVSLLPSSSHCSQSKKRGKHLPLARTAKKKYRPPVKPLE
jgi:hypothetical protein